MTLKHKKIQHKVTKPTTFCDWIKILAPLTLFGSLHHYCRPSNMLGSWTEYLVEFYVLLGWIHNEYSIIQQRVHITKWRTYFKTFSRIHSSPCTPVEDTCRFFGNSWRLEAWKWSLQPIMRLQWCLNTTEYRTEAAGDPERQQGWERYQVTDGI